MWGTKTTRKEYGKRGRKLWRGNLLQQAPAPVFVRRPPASILPVDADHKTPARCRVERRGGAAFGEAEARGQRAPHPRAEALGVDTS